MITVFTPTYNRAHTLPALFASLKRQTSKKFEWLVVDDGSTDNTEALFEAWKAEADFPVAYFKQENGGKHRAVNRGVQLAKGELFLIVDSDDFLTDSAIETVEKWLTSLPAEGKWGGVAGLKVYATRGAIGTSFSGEYVDATSLERDKFNIKGDKAEAFFTDVLKQFPFPAFEGENFITEAAVWYAIAAAGYKLRWFNEPVIVCEYLEDGLTRNAQAVKLRNPQGYLYYYKLLKKVRKGVKNRLSAIYNYAEIAAQLGYDKGRVCRELKISRFTLWLARLAKKLFGKG